MGQKVENTVKLFILTQSLLLNRSVRFSMIPNCINSEFPYRGCLMAKESSKSAESAFSALSVSIGITAINKKESKLSPVAKKQLL